MTTRPRFCRHLLFISAVAFQPAYALINLNQGKDLILVNGTYSFGYDSNVFTRAVAQSSATHNFSVVTDYTRQAGLISVAANAAVAAGIFQSVPAQNFIDPRFGLSLRKRRGRTTGALDLQARRESQPDPDVGQRTEDWNYSTDLDLRYPVNDRYYFTNHAGYAGTFYTDKTAFSDLRAFSEGINLNYLYTSKLALNAGSSILFSDTSRDSTATDYSFTVGASGGILPKLTGNIRFGYQFRDNDSAAGGNETFDALAASTQLKWRYSRRLSVTGEFNESFSTTAADLPIDRSSLGLHALVALTGRYAGEFGAVYTRTAFLGETGAGRHDEMVRLDASIRMAVTRHVRTALGYTYMTNASNTPGFDFIRHTVSLSVTAAY
jgi:hypothetical protein